MPGWDELYQRGSFRGVPFRTQRDDRAGGRRTVTREYPNRDRPSFEDLGRRARRFTIECLVIGDDHFAQRDALIEALEAKGSGLLVHPWYGQMEVTSSDYRCSHSTEQGGMASFSIDFQEAGQDEARGSEIDTQAASAQIADAEREAVAARFGKDFSLDGLPAFAEEGAEEAVRLLTTSAEGAAALLGGAGELIDIFEGVLGAFEAVGEALRSPLDLSFNVGELVQSLFGLGYDPVARVRAALRLFKGNRTPRSVIGMTPVRVRERANLEALADMVAVTTAAEIIRGVSEVRFDSADAAAALRSELSDALDQAASAAADRGADATVAALDTLRLAMVRDIASRSITLARLTTLTPERTLPALLIAYQLYGDRVKRSDALEVLEADIIIRNRVAHPAFVPGGIALKVLSEAGRYA